MFFRHYYAGHLAHASYMVADQKTRTAAVVDPQPDVSPYLEDAERHRLQIRWALLTHLHTDFSPGHLALRDRTGARVALGARARPVSGFTSLGDGDLIELGPSLRLRVIEAPGHTPEAIVVSIHDLHRHAHHPWAVLSGDTLLIGDVGRPAPSTAIDTGREELARSLYQTLHRKLLALPNETLVYPAHGAGAGCGRSPSTDAVSTLGAQRRYNFALQPMSEREFVRLITPDTIEGPLPDRQGLEPEGREAGEASPRLGARSHPLGLAEVLRLRSAGAQVLDVRDPVDFAGAHLVDSVNLPLGVGFPACAGRLLRHDAWTVVVAEPGGEARAGGLLSRLGFTAVGHLVGGMQALADRHDLVRRLPRITAVSLAEELHAPSPPLLVDVRPRYGWRSGRIGDSLTLPLERFATHWHAVPRRHGVVVYSERGVRASIAASLLVLHGVDDVEILVGGIAAWRVSVLPETRGPRRPLSPELLVRSFATRFPAPVSHA